jgi:hypothetical protein
MPKGNGKMYNDKYNAPDNYTDMDGMTKTFTHINYSKKSKTSFHMIEGNAKEQHLKDREILQEEILSLPASFFPKEFQDFVIRGENMDVISWNESMIKDPGVPFNTLTNLKTLTENRIELHSQGLLF